MELSEMNLMEVEERLKTLETEVREMTEVADVEKATEEKKALLERKAELVALEERKANAEALQNDKAVEPIKVIEERKEETKMSDIEVRNTLEYGKAFVKAMLTGDDTEARSLLTTGASGTIPVPETLEQTVANAWENCQIMSLVKKANIPGTYKAAFELSATGATVHVEGAAAPDEEVLTLGTVTITPQSIKKWITVSDEAIDNTTIDTLGYIYAEIAQKIVEKAEDIAISTIIACPATATSTACGVPVLSVAALANDTIVNAAALLCGQAKDLHIAMNRRTYASLVSLALSANYAIDVFDGLKDKVVFTDALKAVQDASSTDTIMIIGDFSGMVANFPNGQEMSLKTDDLSLAEKDLVKVVGREYVGIGVVADKRFVKVALS